jgi:hypothetical protein
MVQAYESGTRSYRLRVPSREIDASRAVDLAAEDVFAFLEHLPNHWRLEPRFAEVAVLGPSSGLVRLRGPLGVSRVVSTRVEATVPPRRHEGTARTGSRTVGRIRWSIIPSARGCRVTLSGRVERASRGDRWLLALGGAYWLSEIFRNALANLPDAVRGRPLERCPTRLDTLDTVLTAGALGAVLSGVPSTAIALARRDDPLEATLAAGSMLVGGHRRRSVLLGAAVPLHVAISLFWAAVLARALPRRRTVLAGCVAGLGIAALDLGVAGRVFPRIRSLPLGPQLADHVAFGAVVGAIVARRRRA